MLLFWKVGNFTEYEVTEKDRIFNYAVGSALIFSFLVSTTLNPFLLYHHQKFGKRGVTTFLFSCLAVSDFLTNLMTPLVYTVFMMSPTTVHSLHSPSFLNVLLHFGDFSCATGCFSQCLATLLAITRHFKIKRPFGRIRKKTLKIYFAVYTSIMIFDNIAVSICTIILTHADSEKTKRFVGKITGIIVIICIGLNLLHCILGVVFSITTVVYVYLTKSASETISTKRVCVTILLMNIVYVITVIQISLQFFNYNGSGVKLFFSAYFLMPIFTSAYNPIILFIRSRQIRQTFFLLINSRFPFTVRNRTTGIESKLVGNGDVRPNVEGTAEADIAL